MRKTYILLFLAFFIVHCHCPVFAQDENYDAVYLRLTKEFTLNSDGSIDYRYIKQQKLQTYRSFHNLYGETFIPYNPQFQSLKINEAYLIMADGKKVSSPANAFNEVLPAAAVNAPAYNGLREMVITHTGTERNAVINLDYELHSKKDFYPCLMGNELLAETEPVKQLTVTIRVPSGMKLHYKILHSAVQPVIVTEGNFQVYNWKFTDVTPISTEEFQKGGNDLYPRLLFSTAPDRSGIYQEFMQQPAFSYSLNGEMEKLAASLVTENKEKTTLLLKLQEKVVNEFRLYPVQLKLTGFTCRTPIETWNSNGGTLAEKAILLTALLQKAGIDANPVFVVRNTWYDDSIGSLSDIDNILVKAETQGTGPVYLSVNTLNPQNLLFCSPGRVFVNLKSSKTEVLKTEESPSQASLKGTFSLDGKKQLTGEVLFNEKNCINPWLSLLRDKDKAKSLIGEGLSATDLKDQGIHSIGMTESSIGYSVQKEKPFQEDSGYYFFPLPVLTNGIEDMGIHLLPKNRITTLEIPCLIEENDSFTFNLPEGMKSFIPEETRELKNKIGSFTFSRKTKRNQVIITRSLKYFQTLIPPESYSSFRDLQSLWNAEKYRQLILVEKQ